MADLLRFQQLQEQWMQELQALVRHQRYLVSEMMEAVEITSRRRSSSEEFERWIEEGASAREKFVEEANLEAPSFLRVIDCEISIQKKAVVIVDWPPDVELQLTQSNTSSSAAAGGYTAISHTFGIEVYSVFNCSCAADCRTRMAPRARADPADSNSPCKDPALHHSIIADVLSMCGQLLLAGVRYAWHDGVCIAQYHKEEVEYFIQHIAWIYANAIDTVIYLHYIGRPMAPIAPPSFQNGPISRWQSRVWTFQEALLSKRRRYCVRMCKHYNQLSDASSYPELLARLASWYELDGPNFTTILDETDFLDLLLKLLETLLRVADTPFDQQLREDPLNMVGWIDGTIIEWCRCLTSWISLWQVMATSFATITLALWNCSKRQSKHEGDRMNSILGLAGVQGFSAHKDKRLEESTMEFFKRMRCNDLSSGLALALFTTNNMQIQIANPQHRGESNTWCPTLSTQLWLPHNHFCNGHAGPDFYTDYLDFKVQNGNDSCLEVSGPLVCVSLHVNTLTDPNLLISEADVVNEDKPYLEVYLDCGDVSLDLQEPCDPYSSKVRLPNKEVIGFANCPFKLHAIIDHSISNHMVSRRSLADSLEEQFKRHDREHTLREFKWSSSITKHSGLLKLIFPGRVLELDFRSEDDHFAAVIVGGDICSQVEKIGCFDAYPRLLTILQEHPHYLTSLHKLVIK